MNYFGTTTFDPIEGSSTSIDPLNSLAYSVKLAEMIFPGTSGRIFKARYLSALCFLIDQSKTKADLPYKENYLNFRKFENTFILTSYLLQDKNDRGLSGLMGSQKSLELINNSPKGIDLSGEILSNQSNLGPLGVHQVLLRNLGLMDEDNLVLTETGKELGSLFKKNLSDDSMKIIEVASSRKKADLDKLKSISQKRFSFNLQDSGKSEAKLILELMLMDKNRKQLFQDLKGVPLNNQDSAEVQYLNLLINSDESINHKYYKLIYNFDFFQRYLHWSFYQFIEGEFNGLRPISKLENFNKNFSTIQKNIEKYALNIKECSGNIEDKDRQGLKKFLDFIDIIIPSLTRADDFCEVVINQHHILHQKAKGKAPWAEMKDENIFPSPKNMVKNVVVEKTLKNPMHNYRYWNAYNLQLDLGMNI